MKKIIKDYFSFNSRERASILFLCCLIAFFWILPNWYPEQKKLPEAVDEKMLSIDSEKTLMRMPANELEKSNTAKPVHLFEFNPNDLSAGGWKKLGVSEKTVQTILHYRERGGKFREPGDLKKIWGLSLSEAKKLIPFVVIPNFKKQPIELSKKMPETILINQATMADLLLLPGMTKQLAARLIKYRDKMGGFKRVEQIRKTYGLSDSLYQLMVPLVVL